MIALHRTLTLGYLGQHPTRTVLVVVSIALGVATLVATQALNRGLKIGAEQAVNPLAGLADLLVVNSQSGVPIDLAREIRQASEKGDLPGIVDARPFILTRVAVDDLENRSVWLFGFDLDIARKPQKEGEPDWGVTTKLTRLQNEKRRRRDLLSLGIDLLAHRPLVFVDEKLAHDVAEAHKKLDRDVAKPHAKDGEHFTIRIQGHKPTLTIVGTVAIDASKLPLKDSIVLMGVHSASALAFPQDPGKVNQINITLAPGIDRDQARHQLAGWLGSRGQVQTVEASRALVSDVTAGLEIGLGIGGAVALVVGLFLVYNVLSVSVNERRHDIGILRSVGATRTQIAFLFVNEAAGLGFLGSALGLPFGIGLAWAAIGPLSRVVSDLLVPMDNARIDASPRLLVGALVAGTLVAILAALVPALQAAREEPADAVRRVPRRHPVLLFFLQLGAILLLVTIGALIVHFRRELPHRFGIFAGIISILLGCLVATPIIAGIVGRIIQPFFRHFLGLEGRLAADNLVRAPGRTGLVIAALAATGGLMVETAGFLRSTEVAIFDWVEEKIAADLFVTSGSAVTAGGFALSMNEKMRDELLAMPEVEAALPVRFYRLDYEQRIVFLIALDSRTFDERAREAPLARSLARFPRLREPGTCLVSENFAALNGVHTGQKILVPDRTGKPIELEVLGTVVDYTWNRGTILVDWQWYKEVYADHQVDVVDLFLKKDADREVVRKKITQKWGKEEALIVITRPEVYDEVRLSLKKIYGMAYAQQMVVGVVALLGVVSALFISVLQRRRELGLLRAVGASRGQILWSVLAEAVLMGVIGATVGFFIGLLLEWYVLEIMLIDEVGFTFPLRVPWFEAGVVILGSVVLATLAGLWPAYLATRLRIPEAIAYE